MDCFFSLLEFHVDADIMLCHTTVCGCTFFPQNPLLYSDSPPTRLFLSYFETRRRKFIEALFDFSTHFRIKEVATIFFDWNIVSGLNLVLSL